MVSDTRRRKRNRPNPYSMERLEEALNLFRRQKPRLLDRGLPFGYLEEFVESGYDLRTRKSDPNDIHCDVDDTDTDDDDYVPGRSSQKKRAAKEPDPNNNKKPKTDGGASLPVILKLPSVKGKELLSNMSDNSSEKTVAARPPPARPASPRPATPPSPLTPKFRSLLDCNRNVSRRLVEESSDEEPEGTRSLLSLDPKHPATRGCKSCWEYNRHCSLLSQPRLYPCNDCRDDHSECDLIVPPRMKRACEACRREKADCSYDSSADNHKAPCQRCRKTKTTCIAGPAGAASSGPDPSSSTSFLFSRPSLPDSNTVNALPSSSGDMILTRNHGNSKWLTKSSEGTVTDQARLESLLARPWNPHASDEESPETIPDPTQHMPSVPSPPGSKVPATKVISTCFAHPINFAYEPPESGGNPCHFCDDFTYGLLGLGRTTVEVIDYGIKEGLVEVDGGHVGKGHEPTRMCTVCAFDRLHIMHCEDRHQIAPLRRYDPVTFDFSAAFSSLTPSQDGKTHAVNPWCSLCPNPAFFGCTALQTTNKFQEPVDPMSPEAKGCGLLLCMTCAELMKTCGSDVPTVLGELVRDQNGDGVRADAVFLMPGNGLYRFYYT